MNTMEAFGDREEAVSLRDHLCAWVQAGELMVVVDNYEPGPGEAFDLDILEGQTTEICAQPTRDHWQLAYRLARTLVRHGSAVVNGCANGSVAVTVPCYVTIS